MKFHVVQFDWELCRVKKWSSSAACSFTLASRHWRLHQTVCLMILWLAQLSSEPWPVHCSLTSRPWARMWPRSFGRSPWAMILRPASSHWNRSCGWSTRFRWSWIRSTRSSRWSWSKTIDRIFPSQGWKRQQLLIVDVSLDVVHGCPFSFGWLLNTGACLAIFCNRMQQVMMMVCTTSSSDQRGKMSLNLISILKAFQLKLKQIVHRFGSHACDWIQPLERLERFWTRSAWDNRDCKG